MVDITDVNRRIIAAHESIPVSGSELTLLYPQWIPGDHSPTGPLSRLAGLRVSADGRPVPWTRDRVDVYAFHIAVPPGVKVLDVDFDYLAPMRDTEGRISMTTEIADFAWDSALLYPAGYFSRRITVSPSIKLPDRWQFASALEVQPASTPGAAPAPPNVVQFKDTTLNTLVDSPVYAGSHFKRVDLSSEPGNPVHLDLFADNDAALAFTPEQLQLHRNLVSEAARLYGSHHYAHYDFLLSLSDKVGGMGLEHHQSSEDGIERNYFTDWTAGVRERDLLAHEYTHSWNGKFRRPADLWTPNFNVPMQDDLLWVYEGMTEYWGYVLTARSGLRTAAQTRDLIAEIAAEYDVSLGRTWRPLIDTTNQPTISMRAPVPWVSWLRPEDYYREGLLIWLDADTRIRELSGDKRSLDDFARLFFGIENGSYVTHTYSLDDVVAALNAVQPYDWATFLRTRVYELAPQTPKDGIARGGYTLAYSDAAPDWREHADATTPAETGIHFLTSLGINIEPDGSLSEVLWEGPAWKAGMTRDMKVTAVNGESFNLERLKTAIAASQTSREPIQLLVKRGEEYQTVSIDYHGGPRYPVLQRNEGTPDRLDAILAPSK